MKKILEKLIHVIIPHEKNNNIPHILKGEFVLIMVLFVGILFYFNQHNFNIIQKLNLTATVYPAVLADLTNQDRATSGIQKLVWSDTLENAAKLKAQDMLTNGYFAHTSPSGITPWHWLKVTNYNFTYAGENLAVDFTESVNVQNAWLNSPKHRENILNSHFTEIGIATVDGVFEGKDTTFVVEFFGSPSKQKVNDKLITDKKLAVNNTDKVITPSVAGVSTNIKILEETEKFISVKNENITEEEVPLVVDDLKSESLSTWYERFIVNPARTTRFIYITIFGLILVSILLMLSKEYQKHHTKHLIIGLLLLIMIAVFLYIISTNNIQIFFKF